MCMMTMEEMPEKKEPEKFTKEDAERGFTSCPIGPAFRRAVERRDMNKMMEDMGYDD